MGFAFAETRAETLPIDVRVNDLSGVVERVSASVVSINITMPMSNRFRQTEEATGSGSGIIFAEDGERVYVATNYHVIENAERVSISLDDEYQIEAVYVGGEGASDLAVISVRKTDMEGIDYALAVFGDSDKMRVGDEVIAVGNAMGEGKTATYGIISAINRQITIDGKTLDVMQTDAAINPGNSGGALANINGEVVGINTAKALAYYIEGTGYSLPSNAALEIIEQLLADGTAKKPYLGITPLTVDEAVRRRYELPSLGVMAREVARGGPAETAGLVAGDLIVGYNGVEIKTADDLAKALAESAVGDDVTLRVYRLGSELLDITVTLGDANNP
jgi:serine protease Do